MFSKKRSVCLHTQIVFARGGDLEHSQFAMSLPTTMGSEADREAGAEKRPKGKKKSPPYMESFLRKAVISSSFLEYNCNP